MNRFLKTICLLWLCLPWIALQAQQPEEIVKQLIRKTENGALKAGYTIAVTEKDANAPIIYRGSILMKGDKFNLQADGLEIAYDGKTQWAYVEETEEINISEPTQEEVAEINPILLAKNMAGTCKLQFSSTQKSNDKYIIDFFPDAAQTGIKKLSLTLRKTDLAPLAITMRGADGMLTEITLNAQQFNAPAADKDFQLNPSDYPDALVNDLR